MKAFICRKTAACCGWKLGWLEQWKFIRTEKLSEPPKKSKMKKKNWAESLCLIILGRSSLRATPLTSRMISSRPTGVAASQPDEHFFQHPRVVSISSTQGDTVLFSNKSAQWFSKVCVFFLNNVFVYDCYTAWIWLWRQDLKYKRSAVFKYSHRGEKEKKKNQKLQLPLHLTEKWLSGTAGSRFLARSDWIDLMN